MAGRAGAAPEVPRFSAGQSPTSISAASRTLFTARGRPAHISGAAPRIRPRIQLAPRGGRRQRPTANRLLGNKTSARPV